MTSGETDTTRTVPAARTRRDTGRPSPAEERQAVLSELRAELDAVDAIVLNALLIRYQCTRRIGRAKESHGIPVMQTGRVRLVLERATAFGLEHGMNPLALQDVFVTLIEDACRAEEGAVPPIETAWDRIAELTERVKSGAHTTH
ncbi:chorismate mutase [Streptomyces viridosporus]|uniref:chorismate mutase n=1 Tax=Streptomyces viridosporus TaxID=67581 RepID=UPI0002D9CDCF|nr:chorismate mutase [Streptomyces viridosporus]